MNYECCMSRKLCRCDLPVLPAHSPKGCVQSATSCFVWDLKPCVVCELSAGACRESFESFCVQQLHRSKTKPRGVGGGISRICWVGVG